MTPLFFPLKQELQNSIPLARRRQSLLSQTLSYSLMFKERQELGDRHKVQKVGRPGDLEQGGRERVVCDGVCGSWREASGRNPLSCCFTERRLLGAKGKRNHQEGNAGQEARRGGCPWSTPLQLQLL